MKDEPVIVERTLNAPVSKVWNALTRKEEMKEWYFDIVDFKAEPGFEFRFTGGPEDRIYYHVCRITELEVNRIIGYTWRFDGYEGVSHVTFELFPEGEKTKIRLTHVGIGNFKPYNPDLDRSNFVQGWNSLINESLPKYLE